MRISDWSSDVCSSDLDGAGLAELVDLDHIRNDAALHRLPHEARRQADGEDEAAKRHKSPVLRLHAGAANPVVPRLRCALIGCRGFGRLSVTLHGPFESHDLIPFFYVGGCARAAAVARLDRVEDRKSVV